MVRYLNIWREKEEDDFSGGEMTPNVIKNFHPNTVHPLTKTLQNTTLKLSSKSASSKSTNSKLWISNSVCSITKTNLLKWNT